MKILEKGESSTGFALEIEITEVGLDSFELVPVVDSDDGRVEWLVDVSMDLGLLDINTTPLLDENREFSRGIVFLGQIVEVDILLLTMRDNTWLHWYIIFMENTAILM
jgi:hypothetical protein